MSPVTGNAGAAPDAGATMMDTGFMIKVTIVLTWILIALAGCGLLRFYDLVVQGWPALAALLGIMIGGKTMERVKELHGAYFGAAAAAASATTPKSDEGSDDK